MAKGPTNQPRISANKLAEFITAKAGRQRQILRDQKFPQDFKGMYYREATEAISQCIASNLEKISIVENAILSLEQQTTDKIGTQRRIDSNIDALEAFETLFDEVDLKGATPSLGSHQAPKLTVRSVEISVRPEIVLRGVGKSGVKLTGALKLHFPRTFPLGESAGYVSALLQEYSKIHLTDDGETFGPYCSVIDVGAKKIYGGAKATVARMRDIEAACQNIAGLWPGITPSD